jgi:hypothetical protein
MTEAIKKLSHLALEALDRATPQRAAIFAKRHYEVIAQVLQDQYRTRETHESLVDAFADAFARDNGQFKRDRFERACEPGANVRARS